MLELEQQNKPITLPTVVRTRLTTVGKVIDQRHTAYSTPSYRLQFKLDAIFI